MYTWAQMKHILKLCGNFSENKKDFEKIGAIKNFKSRISKVEENS